MRCINIVQLFSLMLLFNCCSYSSESEKEYDSQKNIVNVKKDIVRIEMDEKDISIFGTPYILDEYLIISDYQSPDKLIHIFDRNTFNYIISVGNRGEGPREIANLGGIVVSEKERKFYVIDYGQQKILGYPIDSALINPFYKPEEKAIINEKEFPSTFQYVNDTLSFALFIKKMENGNYKPVVAKWNMQIGKTVFMNYSGHPQIKRKRVSFASSVGHGLYVEAYWHNDLMSLCTMDGNLKYNLYGENWNDETSNRNLYFKDVAFCKDKIVASYLGEERVTQQREGIKVNNPTKLLVFNLEGDYIATLEIEYPIFTFCFDSKNNRVIFAFDDEVQFGYLDLDRVLLAETSDKYKIK